MFSAVAAVRLRTLGLPLRPRTLHGFRLQWSSQVCECVCVIVRACVRACVYGGVGASEEICVLYIINTL